MKSDGLKSVLPVNNGPLPDIKFNFGGVRSAADAYALLQRRASALTSVGAYYWSKSMEKKCPVSSGENPAKLVPSGEAELFHVVFGGVTDNQLA